MTAPALLPCPPRPHHHCGCPAHEHYCPDRPSAEDLLCTACRAELADLRAAIQPELQESWDKHIALVVPRRAATPRFHWNAGTDPFDCGPLVRFAHREVPGG